MGVLAIADDGAVRSVTLDRPEKRNALNAEMLRGLEAAFSETPAPQARVVALRAAGPVFCAGIDLRERLDEGAPGNESSIETTLHAIESYPLPVVAVVQGPAIAGGNELALHCDIVVASTRATFGMSLAQIGLAPSWFPRQEADRGRRAGAGQGDAAPGRPDPRPAHVRLGPHRARCRAGRLRRDRGRGHRAAGRQRAAVAARHEGAAHPPDGLPRRRHPPRRRRPASSAATRGSHDAREGMAARLEKRRAEFTGR